VSNYVSGGGSTTGVAVLASTGMSVNTNWYAVVILLACVLGATLMFTARRRSHEGGSSSTS